MTETPDTQDPIRMLIVGCGGIGGVMAAKLHAARTADISVVSTNEDVYKAVQHNGFVLTGLDGQHTVAGSIERTIPDGPFDFIVLAVRPPQVEEAASQAVHALAEAGAMVVLQNGLCEHRVATIVGEPRTIGGIVSFGASMPQPGTFELTAHGGITLGTLDNGTDPRLAHLQAVFAPLGDIQISRNLLGARYSKLALNCAVSGMGTVAGVVLGRLLRHASARNLALEIMREVVRVSRAEGVDIEPIAGTFDLNWLADPDARNGGFHHWLRHLMLLIVGLKYRRLRSSMLRAIERGRAPAVAFLNGEIVARGAKHGIATPHNAAIHDTVLQIAAREVQSDIAHLETIRATARKTA